MCITSHILMMSAGHKSPLVLLYFPAFLKFCVSLFLFSFPWSIPDISGTLNLQELGFKALVNHLEILPIQSRAFCKCPYFLQFWPLFAFKIFLTLKFRDSCMFEVMSRLRSICNTRKLLLDCFFEIKNFQVSPLTKILPNLYSESELILFSHFIYSICVWRSDSQNI